MSITYLVQSTFRFDGPGGKEVKQSNREYNGPGSKQTALKVAKKLADDIPYSGELLVEVYRVEFNRSGCELGSSVIYRAEVG